jgi:hypothetical protein
MGYEKGQQEVSDLESWARDGERELTVMRE